MDSSSVNREQTFSILITDAVRRFAALPPDRQEMALLILRGVQIGEDLYAQTARPNA